MRVGVRITARKTNKVNIALTQRPCDLARDVMRALDEIGHRYQVADAFPSVAPKVAGELHGLFPGFRIGVLHKLAGSVCVQIIAL